MNDEEGAAQGPANTMSKFPARLLTATVKERVDYFKDEAIVDHPNMDATLTLCDEKANSVLDRRLILLVGPTGVGKSAVLKKLVERRNARRRAEASARPEIVSGLYIEAEAPDRGAFDFVTLYREGLVEMKAALIERTMPLVERKAHEGTLVTLAIESSARHLGRDSLKLRFKSELISREVEVLCIDEAINLFKTGKRRTEKERQEVLKDQADKLKTFTNKTPASIILSGAFDFFELTCCSAQIARRSLIVVMEPYTMAPQSLAGFGTALVGLIAHLPIAHKLEAGARQGSCRLSHATLS